MTVKYAKERTSEQKLVIAQLTEKLNEYQSRLPLNIQEDELMEQTKIDLEDKVTERTKGIMFRSKAKWYAEGERNTKYFYSLEKARYNAKTCFRIISDRGDEISEPVEILQEQRKFYKELYQKDEDVQFNMKNTHDIQVPEQISRTTEQDPNRNRHPTGNQTNEQHENTWRRWNTSGLLQSILDKNKRNIYGHGQYLL